MLKPTCQIAVECSQHTAREVAHEISNCFNFIAPVSLLRGPTDRTRFILNVVLRKHPYWNSSDEGADEAWEQCVKPWLAIKIRTVQNTIEAYGKKKAERGQDEVAWHSAILVMEPYSIEVGLSDNRFPADVMERIEGLRAALNSGGNPFDEHGRAVVA